MCLFKKQKNKEENNANRSSMSDKVAGKIACVGIRVQRVFAEGMNKIFRNMNTKKLKGFLILFCICAGGYSIIWL